MAVHPGTEDGSGIPARTLRRPPTPAAMHLSILDDLSAMSGTSGHMRAIAVSILAGGLLLWGCGSAKDPTGDSPGSGGDEAEAGGAGGKAKGGSGGRSSGGSGGSAPAG